MYVINFQHYKETLCKIFNFSSTGDPILIYLGAHNMPPTASDQATTVLGHVYELHPDWNVNTLQNDIGLILLFEQIQPSGKF